MISMASNARGILEVGLLHKKARFAERQAQAALYILLMSERYMCNIQLKV